LHKDLSPKRPFWFLKKNAAIMKKKFALLRQLTKNVTRCAASCNRTITLISAIVFFIKDSIRNFILPAIANNLLVHFNLFNNKHQYCSCIN